MSQNLISVSFSDAQLAAVDSSLDQIETQLSELVALTTKQRQVATKMGPRAEIFCRQTLDLLAQNQQVIPPNFSLQDAQSDLTAMDRLRPRLKRLVRLSERASDTQFALSNDVMRASLKGYSLLKVVGENQGLEALRKSIGTAFNKTARQAAEVRAT
ncbi:MAG: hypothetical protein ABI411_21300 [Tahibacter sp.]